MTALSGNEDLKLRNADPAPEVGLTRPPVPLREAIGLYLLCLALMLSAGLLLQTIDLRIGLIVTEAGLILLPTLYFIQKNRLPFREALNVRPASVRVLLLSLLITVPLRICSFLISAAVQTIFPMPNFVLRSLENVYAKLLFHDTPLDLGLTILGIVVLAAVCEEALFRGFILNTLLKRKKTWSAIILTSLGFAIYHLDPWAFPEVVIIGIFLGWLVVRTGSIFPAMLAHGSFNFIGIIIFPRVFGVTSTNDFFRISFPAYVYPVAFAFLAVLLYSFVRLTETEAVNSDHEKDT